MTTLTLALQKACYNELVEATVDNDTTVVLTACLDCTNGGVTWQSVTKWTQRHLRTKRWFFPMLNDKTRNELYVKAIEMACAKIVQDQNDDKCINILDIGTGTGFLSIIACKALDRLGCSNYHIDAVEMSSSMAELAKLTLAENNASNVQLHAGVHSSDLHTNPHFCISELLEDGLLGEGWLPAIRNMPKSCIQVPQGAKVFAQLVDASSIAHMLRVPTEFVIDNETTLYWSLDANHEQLFHHDNVRLAVHAQKLLHDKTIIPLSGPIQIIDIDLNNNNREKYASVNATHKSSTTVATTSAGSISAVLVWWDLILWQPDFVYSMRPGKQAWQDHWHAVLHILPNDVMVKDNTSLTIHASHDDYSISVSLSDTDCDIPCSKKSRTETDTNSFCISNLRTSQLCDTSRLQAYSSSIRKAINEKGVDAIVLDISDFSVCAALAALIGAKRVYSLESGSNAMASAQFLQLGNSLPRPDCNIQVLQCHAEQLETSIFGAPVDILVAEPFYEVLHEWSVIEAINLFYIVNGLRRREIINKETVIMPNKCCIMAVAVNSKELKSAYTAADDFHVFGSAITHHQVNEIGADFINCNLSLPMWQYNYTHVSKVCEICTLDYVSGSVSNELLFVDLDIDSAECHAILVWVEYHLLPNVVISTMNQKSHQLVRMIQHDEKRISKLSSQFRLLGCENGDLPPFELDIQCV